MNRAQAFEELKLRLFDRHILFRSLVVEAIMEELAGYFNADTALWGLTGLLHDIDYEKTLDRPGLHGITGAEILENLDVDEAVVYSVRAHNDRNNIPRKRKMDKALYLSDYVADYIINYCSRHKPIAPETTVEAVLQQIRSGELHPDKFEELGIAEQEFVELALKAFEKVTEP
ncbi:HDIG domain-containing metalloprotein [Ruminiclostridium cellobioparum]|uniref:HDIG domain-containing metalloprotein n=1 Tax=Ruminiclostridium cellobioparum TaxID=29355 RepID=UPI00048640E6|nr:HDIG domain-containing metalloprotein [Ruminiclostridium cellobioparum]